ncbi:MAG: hypothetical protein V4567_09705 [Pseudomonadota bacterium]|nr:hypothetical protein [Rhodanobacteraceae bacterium]
MNSATGGRVNEILIGRNGATAVGLDPHFGNRHGMIAGAAGTISAVRNRNVASHTRESK